MGGVVSGIAAAIGGIASLFGGGREQAQAQQAVAAAPAAPEVPDVTQTQDSRAAAEEARRRQIAAQANSTTRTGGLGLNNQATTTRQTLG